MADRLLTKDEVAAMVGVPANAVAVAARRRRLAYVRIGKEYRYRVEDVDAWVESQRVSPIAKAELEALQLTPRSSAWGGAA
jgi:excisionase family DNA binding protein